MVLINFDQILRLSQPSLPYTISSWVYLLIFIEFWSYSNAHLFSILLMNFQKENKSNENIDTIIWEKEFRNTQKC